jgi:hypothetical protein
MAESMPQTLTRKGHFGSLKNKANIKIGKNERELLPRKLLRKHSAKQQNSELVACFRRRRVQPGSNKTPCKCTGLTRCDDDDVFPFGLFFKPG